MARHRIGLTIEPWEHYLEKNLSKFADRIHEGIVVGQVRTNNVLYLAEQLVTEQDFGEPTALEIAAMWKWSGQPWGGLPDGTSIADHIEDKDNLPNKASQPIAAKRGSG